MRKVKRYFSGIIAMLLLIASIPLNVFGATTLAITAQPASKTVLEGKSASFSVTATGATSYQWQLNKGSGWVGLSYETCWPGCKSNKLTVTGDAAKNGYKFRCVVSDGSKKINSNEAVLTILMIKTQPSSQTIIEGNSVSFSVAATGAKTYQWQINKGSSWVSLSNNTTWPG